MTKTIFTFKIIVNSRSNIVIIIVINVTTAIFLVINDNLLRVGW